jgi:uncharacterized protein
MVRLLALLWCLAVPAFGWGAEPVAIPPMVGRVTDLTSTLSPDQAAALEALLARIEREKGAQLAILMLPTTGSETIELFGIRLAENWKVGRLHVDDGAIVIVAKDDHKARIEVGRGLEGAIPDAIAKRVVSEVMAPKLKEGDFAGGLQAAISALGGAIGGEALPASPAVQPVSASGTDNNFVFLFLALMLGGVLRSLLGLFGATLAAVIAGWLAWAIFASWIAAIIAAVITLLFSFARGGGRGWSAGGIGGASGGFSGSSSGGGGFTGGGGDFGGGGASGNW